MPKKEEPAEAAPKAVNVTYACEALGDKQFTLTPQMLRIAERASSKSSLSARHRDELSFVMHFREANLGVAAIGDGRELFGELVDKIAKKDELVLKCLRQANVIDDNGDLILDTAGKAGRASGKSKRAKKAEAARAYEAATSTIVTDDATHDRTLIIHEREVG